MALSRIIVIDDFKDLLRKVCSILEQHQDLPSHSKRTAAIVVPRLAPSGVGMGIEPSFSWSGWFFVCHERVASDLWC